LRVTTSTDAALVGKVISLTMPSATATTYLTGASQFSSDAGADPTVDDRLLALTGSQSIYVLPVAAHSDVVGVIIVGWRDQIASLGDRRARAVSLLAAEAGVALHQSRLLSDMAALAITDPLTGALNRRGWDDRLAYLLASAHRTGEPLTIGMTDLDHFKAFNDRLGHSAGDRLLKAFVSASQAVLRSADTVARWGGEEFAIALPNCPEEQAGDVLDRLRRIVPDDQTCSVGYATWDGVESREELMHRVDLALYQAKTTGRDRTVRAASTSRYQFPPTTVDRAGSAF
jgi:diguanylate cyclase (GGDEF)-like protein